jgi:hypothetical protein
MRGKTKLSGQPQTVDPIITAIQMFQDKAKELAVELPGITLGYPAMSSGETTTRRRQIFLPHPGSVGLWRHGPPGRHRVIAQNDHHLAQI